MLFSLDKALPSAHTWFLRDSFSNLLAEQNSCRILCCEKLWCFCCCKCSGGMESAASWPRCTNTQSRWAVSSQSLFFVFSFIEWVWILTRIFRAAVTASKCCKGWVQLLLLHQSPTTPSLLTANPEIIRCIVQNFNQSLIKQHTIAFNSI